MKSAAAFALLAAFLPATLATDTSAVLGNTPSAVLLEADGTGVRGGLSNTHQSTEFQQLHERIALLEKSNALLEKMVQELAAGPSLQTIENEIHEFNETLTAIKEADEIPLSLLAHIQQNTVTQPNGTGVRSTHVNVKASDKTESTLSLQRGSWCWVYGTAAPVHGGGWNEVIPQKEWTYDEEDERYAWFVTHFGMRYQIDEDASYQCSNCPGGGGFGYNFDGNTDLEGGHHSVRNFKGQDGWYYTHYWSKCWL